MSEAAEKLFISQPSVSQAIKEIEDKLSSNLNRGFEINNQVFSMDKESIYIWPNNFFK